MELDGPTAQLFAFHALDRGRVAGAGHGPGAVGEIGEGDAPPRLAAVHHGVPRDGGGSTLLLGRGPGQIARWAGPAGRLSAVVSPSFERAFSFADLVSLRVAAQLREANVSDHDLRRGVAALRAHFGSERPLADQAILGRLATSGRSFLVDLGDGWVDIGHGGQGVFQSVVRLYLQRLQFNDAGQPNLWRPAHRVALDPRIQAGAPCIEGTRVPTATIADLLQSEDAKDIALDFDLSVEDVFAAAAFEESLERGVALAL